MRVFVHSRMGLGIEGFRERFQNGLEHGPAPYGLNLAACEDIDVSFSKDGPYKSLSRKLVTRFGLDPVHALYNLRAMRRADVIWTVLEWEWLAISLMQRIGLLRRIPLIGNSVWLFDGWPIWSRKRRAVVRWLMTDSVYLTLHSSTALERAKHFVPDRTFRVSPFGISSSAFPLKEPEPEPKPRLDRPIRIYSIGDDHTRDWGAMLDAFGNDPRFEVIIVCRWIQQKYDLGRYNNVRRPVDVKVSDQRAFYEWADVVVMPMRENSYSGITVVCEAVARGKPVISSATGGVPTYFDPEEVVYVPPADSAAMRDAVLALTPAAAHTLVLRAQSRFRRSGYSDRDMVNRYLSVSRMLLQLPAEACGRRSQQL